MKKILLIFVILLNTLMHAQLKNIYNGKIDSVIIKNFSYQDRETSTVNDEIESTRVILLSSKKLTEIQIKKLDELLKSKKSYIKQRALLSHFNKKIEYFFNGNKIQDITISSMTKNITIYREEKCIYKAKMSFFLEKGIKNLEK
ncbi:MULTISPECIES: hypothetical protein [Chryseobacterium]|jgi:hypothetical protein|uniref:hypothetical protein n=1 Tax=Chryseobacterium TaxID=59732 RepID=UPI000F5024C3|nr:MULTISPECIES: hypothetical protein [Chryseobacterium]MDY0931161.1 hypothetical protein [Chryseobacterium sp. CFBP8996]